MERDKEEVRKPKKDADEYKEKSTNAFDKIENDFKSILNALEGDTELQAFRVEHEKLFQALKKSYHQERYLAKRCEELSREITSNAARVQEVIQSSQQDQSTINLLKQDSEKAWALVEAGKKREQIISHKAETLQEEVNKLSDKLQEERASSLKIDDDLRQVTRERDELKTLNHQALREVTALKREKDDLLHKEGILEERLEEVRNSNKTMIKDNEEKSEKLNTMAEKLKEAQNACDRLNLELDQKTSENVVLKNSEISYQKQLEESSKDLNATKSKLKRCEKEIEDLVEKTVKLSGALESQKNAMSSVTSDLHKNRDELKLALSIQSKLKSENKLLQRKYDGEHKVVLSLKQAVEDSKTASLANQKEIYALQRENDECAQREEKALRQMSTMEREKNVQTEKLQRVEKKVREAEEAALQHEQSILSLEKELSSSKETIANVNSKLIGLEKMHEKVNNELAQEKHVVEQERGTIKIKDAQIQDLKRDVENLKQKITNESKLLNNMKVERNKALRDLKISNDEIASLKSKLSISGNEIKSLQTELGLRDSQIVKEHFEKKQEMVKREQVSNELCRVKEYTSNQDEIIRKQELDVQTLHSSLKTADEQALEQRKEYDQIVSERDILAAQLIRRNDELALLHEKVKSQQITLKNGELQYTERLNDIRLLTIKIQELQREVSLKKHMNHDDSHITLLAQKDKELLQERIKVKALSEELENPMNVHRWRKLEGSDPTIFEMIQKIDLLQKRLIKKTEMVIQKDAIIHQKTQEYEQLQEQLNRHPGSEVAEKLIVKENEVKEKGRQMKAMAGELNMHQSQILEYRKEIERLQNELQEMKMKLYDMKKKEAVFKEREIQIMAEAGLLSLENVCREESERMQLPRRQTTEVQFVGGGFRLGPV